MQFDWRAISGPVLTIATALIAIAVDRYFVAVPNPAPLFICIVAFAASLSGLASGMVSAAVAVGGAALFFLNHHATPGYEAADLARLLLLAMTAAGTAAITGLLRKKLMDAFALGAPALRHRRAPVGGAGPGRHRHRAARFRHPRGIHQPRLPRLFLASGPEGRQQAALHRADVSRPRHRRLRTAGRGIERLHRASAPR